MDRLASAAMRRVLLAFEPPDGGVAENVAQLALGLGDHGWQVELAAPRQSIVDDRGAAAGIPVHRLDWARGYGHPGHDYRSARQLARCLRRKRFDLLHCHSAKAGVIGRLVGPAARVPVVYSPHCFPFIGEFGPARRIFATTVERALAPLGDRIICVCEYERQQGRRIGIAERRLAVVRNGCAPCPTGIQEDEATQRFAGDSPLVASIAVLRRQKRLDVLIDASPSILARAPHAKVAVIGDGPLRDELTARAARLGLDSEPRFAFLPFASSTAHLAATDVFVLPSSWEALAIGLLEALACGTPTVATDVGGSSEVVVPETGILVPPGDPEALADGVVSLLLDPQRRATMAAAARKRHGDRFRVERMIAETAAIYDEVASIKERRRAA
jgi:glycosyltransferase involved in cell wall biosynthesis